MLVPRPPDGLWRASRPRRRSRRWFSVGVAGADALAPADLPLEAPAVAARAPVAGLTRHATGALTARRGARPAPRVGAAGAVVSGPVSAGSPQP